jgi:ADP-dependent NAD(P)H-hydrate dehydratase / NAD(P)H-hydrate epimerase
VSEALYLAEGIRRIEASAGAASPPLMERAGAAVAELAARLASSKNKDILVLAGPGNNGGDARIAANRLAEQFFRVTLVTSPSQLPTLKNWGLVVDGLFGIGLKRPLEGPYAELVRYANQQSCPVLAIDAPSGIDADTGRVLGCAVRATHTLTFLALKPGLLTLDGPDHSGEISIDSLGLDVGKILAPSGWVAHPGLFAGALRKRPLNFHKGLAGSVAIVGGAAGMTGAALLSGRAALKLGGGRVYVGLLDETAAAADANALELMLRHADDALGQDLDALVVGPGLGRSERAEALVGAALASDIPCVLDADGLNLMAESADLRSACARRTADTVLTPHPAEAGRLLKRKTADIQADRIEAARRLASDFNAHAVLKGNGSIIAGRDGHWFVNRSGNPGLASAGTGDVLAGIIGALLGQRCTGEAAAVLGVHLHGAAADQCVAEGRGPVGLTAGELIEPARRLWNSWLK